MCSSCRCWRDPVQASDATQLALAGLSDPRLFTFLDLAGTFAFAVSGAVAENVEMQSTRS